MSMSDLPHAVDIVTASAGTGKTYHLTGLIESATLSGGSPETILATTFTIKAAEELRERIRSRLLEKGRTEEAVRLLGARIGTVNGVCGGLIGEFALSLGLSPVAEIISEDMQVRVFREAADGAIARHAPQLDPLARRLGHNEGREPHDWRADVNAIVASARANDMGPETFDRFARRSFESFARILPKLAKGETEEALDRALNLAVAKLLARYASTSSVTKGTANSVNTLLEITRVGAPADMPWCDWARLAKLTATKADDEYFAPLREAASAFARHPRLSADVKAYIDVIFACAGEAMQAYEQHKRKWGFLDFVDQERIALRLVSDPALRPALSERIERVYVDEFQDTSPLQLALFVALSQLAGSSAWVGDPKQAIYGFRGSDPELISRVAPKIHEEMGGVGTTLGKNFRSRPALVAFANDAFGQTFENMGLPKTSVRAEECARADLPGQGVALNVWRLEGKTIGERASALANGVAARLAQPDAWRVEDDGQSRSLAPRDIAILCATNARCLSLSSALAAFGVKVALERDGLFGTLEARLALAGLRWCADQRDTLALAEMAHLLHQGEDQPAWFEASLDPDAVEALTELVPMAEALRALAASSAHKSPLEFADAVLTAGGVTEAVRRWGDPDDRLLNLEALRALVAQYQDERKQNRAPATATDLCAWLAEQEATCPASRATDAVTLLTYHRAKGLEWPLVILADLEREPRNNPFGLHVMSDRAAKDMDWRAPLADRWLRLWPWPLGPQKTGVVLDATALDSPEGREAARIEREERARVLYVGATRARDYLVLALPPPGKKGWAWIEELQTVEIPEVGAEQMRVNGIVHAVRCASLAPADPAPVASAANTYVGPTVAPVAYEPLALRPSGAEQNGGARILETISIGPRLPFAGSPDIADVGEALHRFLAADDPSFPAEKRLGLATRLLKAWRVSGLDPRDVVTMSDRFRDFLKSRWPDSALRREAPVSQKLGDRTLSGRIDAVIDAPSEIVIIDHKSFPGARSQWQAQAEKHIGQLSLYAGALRAASATPRPVRLALHLPISGEVLMLERDGSLKIYL